MKIHTNISPISYLEVKQLCLRVMHFMFNRDVGPLIQMNIHITSSLFLLTGDLCPLDCHVALFLSQLRFLNLFTLFNMMTALSLLPYIY